MSSNNSRWELWAAIAVNASSTVTAARTVTSQSGKFNESRGATGISRIQTGIWLVRLRTGQTISGPDCYAVATPRATQGLATALTGGAVSGGVVMSVNHDSATTKRVTIMAVTHAVAASQAATIVRENVPFDLRIYRRIE